VGNHIHPHVVESPMSPSSATSHQPPATIDSLSQWQLIRLRFARHRLAVAGFFVLIVLYAMALFAECVAPMGRETRNLTYAYCPPHALGVRWGMGVYAKGLRQEIDPVTLKKAYVDDASRDVPLGVWVRGESYRLWGLFPGDRHLISVDTSRISPGMAKEEAVCYLMGADRYGRDIVSRLIHGARISLSVGLIGIAITFVLGLLIGGISGYLGGRLDVGIQRVIEIINAFPQLPLWMALGAAVPADWPALRTYFAITLVLSLLSWTGLARVVRGKILALREEDYALAARLLGASHGRIVFRHLLPGFTSHIIVALTLSVPGMILGETSLSFLGLGLRPPIVSWGVLLQDCMDIKAVSSYPWLLAPVVLIVLTVLCFNFFGDGLRDAADPYATP
jgi:peptide/nickel transport system permease protein